MLGADPETQLWNLGIEIHARPTYNAARSTAGAFNEPAFLGPNVESGFSLTWLSLAPTTFIPTNQADAVADTPTLPRPPRPGQDR